MAEHTLISTYLDDLARRLPADAVDELADGLLETYRHNLERGLDPDAASAAAVAGFGRPAQIAAAFARHSPGRRTAVRLLASGPILAGLWAAALVSAKAWTWPIPTAAELTFGAVLVLTAGLLLVVARSNIPAHCRLAAPACVALMALDATMIATIALAAPVLSWPMAAAVPASIVRLAMAGTAFPRIISNHL